jgi:hypothetical protein
MVKNNYRVSSQSIRSRHAFAQIQHRILHSIQASHEFRQNRQHPIQNPQIEVAVALHFIHLLDAAGESRSMVSTLVSSLSLLTGSAFISKSIFTSELSDEEGVLSAIIYIMFGKVYDYTNSYSVIVRIPCFKQSNT